MDFVGAHAPRADIGILEPDSDDEESTQILARICCSAKRAPTSHSKRRKPFEVPTSGNAKSSDRL